ncbi:MAG: hypothetical protein AAGG09_13515 [Pseudomonadota bacterium]
MWKQASLFALVAAVAACSGDGSPNPVNGNEPADPTNPVEPPPEGVIIPEEIADDIGSVRWERGEPGDGDDELIITGLPLDDSPVEGVYTRAPSEDLPGYLAFSKQDDRLDRIFVALAGETPDSAVRGYVAGEGGQFDIEYGGIFFERDGDFTPPDADTVNGLVSYAGRYAAVTDIADPEQNLRLDPSGSDPSNPLPVPDGATPFQGRTINGKVFMNVDFADNKLNGVIYDRTWSNGQALGDERYILLQDGDIDAAGNFAGNAAQQLAAPAPTEEEPNPVADPPRAVGSYAGTFGGENASGMVGAFSASEHIRRQVPPDPDDPGAPPAFEDVQFSTERGIWTIPRCGESNSDPVCGELRDVEGIIAPQ